jgi:hypothetical protein
MPERAINPRNATGFLLILLPAALALSALFVAWPLILGATLLLVGGNVWQSYEWSKTAQSINPVFQQLIVQNRGEITPIDLSLSANVSGATAKRYLVAKANEFGTGSRQHPERGQVYYFVSVRTLGSIFDDSEQDVPEIAPTTTPVVALQPTSTPVTVMEAAVEPEISQSTISEVAEISAIPDPQSPPANLTISTANPESSHLDHLLHEDPPSTADTAASLEPAPPTIDRPLVTIIQSELAKRLDVHSSTVYKRRSEPNFTEWTRNRDPDGLAWAYTDTTKEYYRVDS